jgi:hypothetical protein
MLMTDSIPQGHGGKRTGAGRKPKAASPVQPTIEIDYNQARARREEALASLAEIELQVKRNELIPADAVQQYWEGMVSRMRGKMLNLPGRLAAATMGCETLQEAEREAMMLVRECLFELAECGLPK